MNLPYSECVIGLANRAKKEVINFPEIVYHACKVALANSRSHPTMPIKARLVFLPLLLALSACGGMQPVTIEQVPIYEGTDPVKDSNIIAETIARTIVDSAEQEAVDVEIRKYRLPENTSWQEMRSFYLPIFENSDWEAVEDLLRETDFVSTLAWRRGGFSSEQVLLASYSPDPMGGRPYLILILFTE